MRIFAAKKEEKNGVLNKSTVELRAGFCLVSVLKMGDSAAHLYPDMNSPVSRRNMVLKREGTIARIVSLDYQEGSKQRIWLQMQIYEKWK